MTHILDHLTLVGYRRSAQRAGRCRAYDATVNGVEYNSLAQASRVLNIPYSTLMHLANKPQPTNYKGQVYTILKGDRTIKTPTRFDDYVNIHRE